MEKIEMKLAGAMLEEYSDRLANDTCNDWDPPKEWTEKQTAGFYEKVINDSEPDREDRDIVSNFEVASYLGTQLSKE